MPSKRCDCENCTEQCRDCGQKSDGCMENCPYEMDVTEKTAGVAEESFEQAVDLMVGVPHDS